MLKAIIFDLDGLMVDSTPVHQEANDIFLGRFGKMHLKSEGGREGMRIIDIIRDYKDIYDLPGSVEDLYRQRQQIFFELVREKLQLFPGLLALLKKLHAKNLLLAIATSADKDYLKIIFEKFPELAKYFGVTITSEEVTRGKPYPDVYQKVLNKLGVKTSEAVVIEDSFNGIMAAKTAGIQVICIPNKRYPDADYSQSDKSFADLRELAKSII